MTALASTVTTRGRGTDPVHGAAVAGVPRVVRRGAALYEAGAPADTVYLVESGLLALTLPLRSGRQRIVSLAGPGEFVGALAPDARTLGERAEALSPTVSVLAFGRDAVDARLERQLFAALDALSTRLRRALEDADRPVAARLAAALVELGERYGHVGADGATRLTLPLTHEHLGAAIGAARETTSSALTTLRERGVVEGTRGRYRFGASALSAAAASLD
jgi:CRP/FNR family transcriptional regulator, cyclic AMP receptor protein